MSLDLSLWGYRRIFTRAHSNSKTLLRGTTLNKKTLKSRQKLLSGRNKKLLSEINSQPSKLSSDLMVKLFSLNLLS
jgi:hypothetical protein